MSEFNYNEDNCVICELGFFQDDVPVKVSMKGMATLIDFSEKRKRKNLNMYLKERVSTNPAGKVLVHQNCRRDFTNTKRLSHDKFVDDVGIASPKKLRSSFYADNPSFDWTLHCMLCGKLAMVDSRHPGRNSEVHNAATLPFRSNLMNLCEKRGDMWARDVKTRLLGCIDLVAAEAVYHATCYKRFSLFKSVTPSSVIKPANAVGQHGRPIDLNMTTSFAALCDWLESEADADFYTVGELHRKMIELSGNCEKRVYSVKRFKQKLQEHYEGFIFFADIEGRQNVVCFKNMAKYFINEKWHLNKKENYDDEAQRIVSAAANIIKCEIRERKYETEYYPDDTDIRDIDKGKTWIPHYLQTLLKTIISSELKQNSIGHCIVQAARPKTVITPTLFGIGVEADHVFGSRWLINELSRLGFSITYDEVNRYKQSVIRSENLANLLSQYIPGTFTQWVADNVDHNIATLDGQGSFHGMGIIAVSTPKDNETLAFNRRPIRRQKLLKVNDLVKGKGITIYPSAIQAKSGLQSLSYKPILHLQMPYTLPPSLCSDLLWHSGWFFTGANKPRPSWSGFMQHIFSGSDGFKPVMKTKSEMLLLPIIDLNSSDETCIYSTLRYIQDQATQLCLPTPCITFDQPLWIKAVDIIRATSMNVVCRLGGFHTMMSFLGSIGCLMKGSGLEEALETVYAPNSVPHMLSGKSVYRALRGHFLVEAALVSKLIAEISPVRSENIEIDGDTVANTQENSSGVVQDVAPPIVAEHATSLIDGENFTFEILFSNNCTDKELEMLDHADMEEIKMLYTGVAEKTKDVESILQSKEFFKLNNSLARYKKLLAERSPTAKLWLRYVEYVEILKIFLRAERTGNWNLHLVAMSKMLNLFAATGHVNYAKSARLYLQLMLELPRTQPWLYHCFQEQGFHTVRRTDRFWAGISTDLAIEQVMMRSLKSRGGLTRGRGMTESVRQQWIYSMHRCAGIHDAMTVLTDAKNVASEQHVELGASRRQRDYTDLQAILDWFDQHEPFDINESRLRSLSSGIIASDGDGVTCHRAEEIGHEIQSKLDNVNAAHASLKRNEQIRSLDYLKPGIQIDKDRVHIHPNYLFNRLIALAQREDDMAPYFEYELTTVPTSLFRDNFMRKAQKSQLANVLVKDVSSLSLQETAAAISVLDGGALLHRVKWPKNQSYKEIAMQYVKYVRRNYGSCVVVFDGYIKSNTIKDHEHQRRVSKTCADVYLNESNKTHNDQQVFLSNNNNKTQFISLLTRFLKKDCQTVHNCTGDADVTIVSCAVELGRQTQVVKVVSDDTDILVMLLYHWNENTMADIFFHSEANKRTKTGPRIWKIKDIVRKLGRELISHILFIHAWGGCDSTSATYGHGKIGILNKIKQSEEIRCISDLMNDFSAPRECIGEVGIRLFVLLYGEQRDVSLNCLRYSKYMEMIATSTRAIAPEKLPPTERAAYFHSLRVHLQVMIWKNLSNNCLKVTHWGWRLNEGILMPISTDLDAAPENLLKFVRCNCKLSTRNTCGNNNCSCRKNGLKCVAACGGCKGENCQNVEGAIFEHENEESMLTLGLQH